MAREKTRVDKKTGEVFDYQVKRFWKCYKDDFFKILGTLKNKQLLVFIHICENITAVQNLYIGTYEQMARNIGVSRPTIVKSITHLKKINFIRKVQNGVWMVNPNIFMYGTEPHRYKLFTIYTSEHPCDHINDKHIPPVIDVKQIQRDSAEYSAKKRQRHS